MAPEQWSDEEPDAHADIYSLGVILYQMLAGDVPFKGIINSLDNEEAPDSSSAKFPVDGCFSTATA
jgi:serine/threonine-protein kinase